MDSDATPTQAPAPAPVVASEPPAPQRDPSAVEKAPASFSALSRAIHGAPVMGDETKRWASFYADGKLVVFQTDGSKQQ